MPDNKIDQPLLRQCLLLSASHLITDSTTRWSTQSGIDAWLVGFERLVDIVVALDAKDDLELETLDAASRACHECWQLGTNYGLAESRNGVRKVATKLKSILDESGRSYRGQAVWVP
ncbi:hypothetical protein DL96DRAFT_1594842 [Flagelloscypha sp. PMI_526]|nr:hypothetical protein DL96DRAFT_1594842 [Flagelloscypha sp. PMI_526]